MSKVRKQLEEWVQDYCRQDWSAGFPKGVELFLDKAVSFFKFQAGGITSEKLGDHSISYNVSIDNLPADLMSLLHPYRRAGGLK